MKIDTKVRHVTKPGENIFSDLGFSKREAERLLSEADKQVKELRQAAKKSPRPRSLR